MKQKNKSKSIEEEIAEKLKSQGVRVTVRKELKETIQLILNDFWLYKVFKWIFRLKK